MGMRSSNDAHSISAPEYRAVESSIDAFDKLEKGHYRRAAFGLYEVMIRTSSLSISSGDTRLPD